MPSIIKDILRVLSSNILVILLGILGGFVVPKFLSIDQYALWKTYGLYAGYVGILHFGFIDGIYLKYGGEDLSCINLTDVKSELAFLGMSQLLVSAAVLAVTFIIGERLLVPVACVILPTNIITFYLFFFQATRQFSSYSLANILRPTLRLAVILAMVIFPFLRNARFIIWGQVAVVWTVCTILSVNFRKAFIGTGPTEGTLFKKEHFGIIAVGVFIMLGNLSSMLFYSMDRWFVKILLPNTDFAFYSFATTMMSLVMVMISSVSMTFYPILAKSPDNTKVQNILLRGMIILGAFSCSAIFVFKPVITSLLPQYIPSLNIIGVLMAGFPAIAVINALYINLFKAKKMERKYFRRVIAVAALSFMLNCAAVWINKNIISIAAATTIAFYLWFLISSGDFPGLKVSVKDWAYTGSVLIVFFVTTRNLSWAPGFIFYCLAVSMLSVVFYKNTLITIMNKIN